MLNPAPNVRRVNQRGSSVLAMAASLEAPVKIIEKLLALGADSHLEYKSVGKTPLEWAMEFKHSAVVHCLVRRGAVVSSQQANPLLRQAFGQTDWHLGNLEYIARLLKVANEDFSAIFLKAVKENNLKKVDFLGRHRPALLNKLRDGETAFITACKSGLEPMALKLLSLGAEMNAVDCFGDTGLHWALGRQHVELVMKLLNAEPLPDVIKSNISGCNALILAAYRGAPVHVIERILALGGMSELSVGERALSLAQNQRHFSIVTCLQDRLQKLRVEVANEKRMKAIEALKTKVIDSAFAVAFRYYELRKMSSLSDRSRDKSLLHVVSDVV